MLIQEEIIGLDTFKSNEELTQQQTLTSPWVVNPYIAAATSHNTRKAYRTDIQHYERWGGKLPATPESVVNYLQAHATVLNARTLSRRLIALRHWHTYQGFVDPTQHALVKKTLIGITRTHGKPKIKAPALTPDDLQKMVALLQQDVSLMALRDNAILQVGFFGGLRRSEIVNLRIEHIQWNEAGIEIMLPTSKTDQTHEGQFCAIPYGNTLLCPVKALKQWLEQANITTGSLFRRILHNKIVTEKALTPLAITHIIKRCARLANLSCADHISPHSLRRGLATSAARANTPIHVIMRAGRWKQVNTVMEYIEAHSRFTENAASHVLQNLSSKTDE